MHRWKFSALAAAAIVSAGLYATDASALALGRVTVQSALGEPLRAEIDLPQITAAEADSLRVTTASPEVFRAQGLEYSSTVNTVRVQLQRRADGTTVLRLTSDRPVNDPFVDLVIDATWSSGHIVRSYTMLFDPPSLRRPPATVTASPQVTAPSAAPAPTPPVASAPAAPVRAAPAPAPAAAPRPAPAAATPAGEVTVRAGDTAGRIANAHRPAGVSLDQMLVALMRANPDAFIRGNVNRLRSGAVLQIPDEAQAQATPAGEARQIIAAQSRDFNEFRRRLATTAPTTEVAAADRSASGSVQTQVEDRRPATTAPDKLTLSKGGVQSQKAEEQLAKDKQASDASARMAELSKNISDLNQLNGASSAASAPASGQAPAAAASTAAAAAAASVPGIPATPTVPDAPASAASDPVESAAPADAASVPDAAASAPEPAPAPQPAPRPAPPPPAPVEEPSFLSTLLEDPLLAGGALAALLALLGYGGYRIAQQRRNRNAVDSSFLESRLQPDSFFGASGGQRVDTTNSELSTGSSMASYSPSQLDAGGDVDPVAEADVYLAYGRDLQAEEILKEAARHTPERTSVHVKLGEIYAKRQDHKALEAVASDVFKLTNGQGPDWARIAELGRGLDPDNALYQPGGRPSMPVADTGASSLPGGGFASTITDAPPASATSSPPDLDLDLDLDLPDDALTEAPPAPSPASAFATAVAAASPEPAPVPELDLGALDALEPAAPSAAAAPASASDELSLMDSGIAPLTSNDAKAPAPQAMEFDLGGLSLDLNAPTVTSTAAQPPAPSVPPTTAPAPLPDDPLSTKLALAEEFNAIGDSEGARTLIEEVIAESSGALKTRAQRLLSELG